MFGLTRRSAWAYVIVLGFPGAIACGLALPAVVAHWTCRGWTATPATVIGKTVTQNEPKGHPDETPTYVYDYLYEYSAGGRTYEAHWLASGRSDGPKRLPAGQDWEVGRTVTVYCNPRDPTRSVVNPARATTMTHLVLLGGFGLVVGPLALAIARRG